ncbi:methyltransferase domain-containing protein [Nocardioides sp. zg-579]|uniref:Methyltransferase domain-containing protein n=1 Tax=Nocardioides marmotae TaxID=2663857 RepID=A0A6I3IVK9_9ACTN|nr:methyltransferase domain-containing protein [Nocardioides marmotae]MCR6030827.1 methyltransferase domain-containing protein [Gordonia jinghuaiqii]MTB94463.1 methyltransferase domain-containing protein [Nocardioides marmotae]QKE01517.1 class I SAM-dependent methyltransferase [Nocardioides marmotae]
MDVTALSQPDRYPLSATYDPAWLLGLDMGPHPLWQLEDLLKDLDVRPGARVLDLGCGKGATSVFLARELDVDVVAFDLWVEEDELRSNLEAHGVADRVTAVNGDVRDLPFDDDEFDVIVSIDAFEYFGTDVRILPSVLRVLKPAGALGMTTPALRTDPYESSPPTYVTDVIGWEAAGWHAPDWWETHWRLSGLVDNITARMQEQGREDWVRWSRALGEDEDGPVISMLMADHDDQIGISIVSAQKKVKP